jgi:DNA polymerase alpha-associated DNA helicase A
MKFQSFMDYYLTVLSKVCWIPIFKARKLILAGDPMQLPPTIISIDKEAKSKSKKKVAQASKKGSKVATKEPPPSSDSEKSAEISGDEILNVKLPATQKPQPILLPSRTLETTLFDRLEQMYGPRIKKMLQVQYR